MLTNVYIDQDHPITLIFWPEKNLRREPQPPEITVSEFASFRRARNNNVTGAMDASPKRWQ